MKCTIIMVMILLMFVRTNPLVQGASLGTGFVLFQIPGYGTIRGQLENATIRESNTIAMTMIVNDQIQTAQGSFPIQATGNWDGVRDGSAISGTIRNVSGKIHICIIFSCNDADFQGQGDWSGQLDNSMDANGNFTLAIAFTSSPYPQIPAGQSIPTQGSWTASFAYPVPEFQWTPTFSALVLLAVAALALRLRFGNGTFSNRTETYDTSAACQAPHTSNCATFTL
jgi:hypothetical protein